MINAVAVQRLLEAAIMLKLERGTRALGGQATPAKTADNRGTAPQQPALVPPHLAPQSQRFSQNRMWSDPPILVPEFSSNITAAVASAPRENASALPAYREALAEAGQPARLPEHLTLPFATAPAPIQYANAELALALAEKAPRAVLESKREAGSKSGVGLLPSMSADRIAAWQRLATIGAVAGGAIILFTASSLVVLP